MLRLPRPGAVPVPVPDLGRGRRYTTLLFNDESHTFDEVIGALRSATGCTEGVARLWANYVDTDGRAVILVRGRRLDLETELGRLKG